MVEIRASDLRFTENEAWQFFKQSMQLELKDDTVNALETRTEGWAIGLPLAVLNVFSLQLTQGQAIAEQNPFANMLDALQPGIAEEVIYRFALFGIRDCFSLASGYASFPGRILGIGILFAISLKLDIFCIEKHSPRSKNAGSVALFLH